MQLGSDIAVAVGCRLGAAAPIRPLALELPYATGEALKKKKKIGVRSPTQILNGLSLKHHLNSCNLPLCQLSFISLLGLWLLPWEHAPETAGRLLNDYLGPAQALL